MEQTVTQVDRLAVAKIEDWDEDHPRYQDLMAGKLDGWTMVQAFRRHREAERKLIVDWLRELGWDYDPLAELIERGEHERRP